MPQQIGCFFSEVGARNCVRVADPLWIMVLMLKPRVGLISEVSSPLMRLTMVVFPALSSPLCGATIKSQ